jgi:hypothetical protein
LKRRKRKKLEKSIFNDSYFSQKVIVLEEGADPDFDAEEYFKN